MKKLIITICVFFCGHYLFAQNSTIETEIKNLEQNEVQAILGKDTITLKRLWDKDYVVNNPENKIVLAKANPVDRPVLQKERTSFTRVVEQVIINGNVAISMGKETVVSMDDASKSEHTVDRRYTNIWMKKDGSWKLIARHANKICR
ncbi:MAG: nuclear transport factor 2 family protein [Panacibacter sp.]